MRKHPNREELDIAVPIGNLHYESVLIILFNRLGLSSIKAFWG
jgi:hypothetical protein